MASLLDARHRCRSARGLRFVPVDPECPIEAQARPAAGLRLRPAKPARHRPDVADGRPAPCATPRFPPFRRATLSTLYFTRCGRPLVVFEGIFFLETRLEHHAGSTGPTRPLLAVAVVVPAD